MNSGSLSRKVLFSLFGGDRELLEAMLAFAAQESATFRGAHAGPEALLAYPLDFTELAWVMHISASCLCPRLSSSAQ